MSLLDIVANVAAEVGVDEPATVINNGDPNIVRLLALAQRSGSLIAKRHDWSALFNQHTWISTAAEAQPDAFPSDFSRMNYMSDIWNETINLRYIGPSNIKDWQWLKHGAAAGASGVIGYWRIIGGQLNLFPAPTAGQTLALEYITSKWAKDSGGTPTTSGRFEADTDEPRVPSELVELDIIWRWNKRHGLDYAEDMSDFERELERASSRDRGMNVVTVGGRRADTPQALTWPGTIGS